MQELIATLGAMHDKENRQNKFLAAIQGIDLSENSSSQPSAGAPLSLSEVSARAERRLGGDDNSSYAIEFGISASDGLGYQVLGLENLNG